MGRNVGGCRVRLAHSSIGSVFRDCARLRIALARNLGLLRLQRRRFGNRRSVEAM